MTVDEMIAATRDWQRHGGFPPLFDADETLALIAEIERLRRAEADMRERAAMVAMSARHPGCADTIRALPLSGDVK